VATLFLAYAAADRDRGLALAAGLRAAGLTVRTDSQLAGDAGWWAGILSAIQEADALVYATMAGDHATMPGHSAPGAVVAERDYGAALGIPTLEIQLSGSGAATGVDFREPDADAAFRLIGAIAGLPARPVTTSWQPSPESPFAGVADLVREVQAAVLAPSDQHALADRLRAAAADPAARELAAILRLRADLDAETVRRLDEAGPADSRVDAEQATASRWSRPGALTADDVHAIAFRKAPLGRRGYDEESVDKFLDQVESDLRTRQAGGPLIRVALTPADVQAIAFVRPPFGRRGYDEEQVDTFLDEIHRSLTALDRDLTAGGAKLAKA
jgi:DivIVA domain-containing protein